MSKLTKSFEFITPLSHKERINGQLQATHIADIIVTGVGYCHRDCEDPFDFDYERIQYQEKGKEPVDVPLELIQHIHANSMDGIDWLDNATRAHLEFVFDVEHEDAHTDNAQIVYPILNLGARINAAYQQSFLKHKSA